MSWLPGTRALCDGSPANRARQPPKCCTTPTSPPSSSTSGGAACRNSTSSRVASSPRRWWPQCRSAVTAMRRRLGMVDASENKGGRSPTVYGTSLRGRGRRVGLRTIRCRSRGPVMDLSLLETLKDKLLHAKQFSKVWEYFLDHFGENPDFVALGERTQDAFLKTV